MNLDPNLRTVLRDWDDKWPVDHIRTHRKLVFPLHDYNEGHTFVRKNSLFCEGEEVRLREK